MIEIRTATESDILAFYGVPSPSKVEAFSIVRDDVIEAIAGVIFLNNRAVFFSDMREGLIAPKLTIWRASREIVERIRELDISAIAITNCNMPNARRYLESLGFVLFDEIDGEKQYRLTNGI